MLKAICNFSKRYLNNIHGIKQRKIRWLFIKRYSIKTTLNIAIIGTRGIPNHYGGFEQAAQHLAAGLVGKGHFVTVYNVHHHPYKDKEWNGVQVVHCYDGEQVFGTAGQFIYDLNCIRDARKKSYDIILFLGYTSSSIWGRLFPGKAVVISNMDGMEWKRTKYTGPVKRFLLYAEKLAVKYSDHLVADSKAVKQYLDLKYNTICTHIPYGAEIIDEENPEVLSKFGLMEKRYYMLMARMEPENNIDMVLDGFCKSESPDPILVIGNLNNTFGRNVLDRFGTDSRVMFTGALFESSYVHTLRKNCRLYFHGHSVGGTNPSLLEAMASGAVIAAHNNEFNRAVLQDDAFYFKTPNEVKSLIGDFTKPDSVDVMVNNNVKKIQEQYNWPAIVDAYEAMMIACYQSKR